VLCVLCSVAVLLCCGGGKENGMLLSIRKILIYCLENLFIIICFEFVHLYLFFTN
jgi:hypothetical protein